MYTVLSSIQARQNVLASGVQLPPSLPSTLSLHFFPLPLFPLSSLNTIQYNTIIKLV